MKRFSTNTGMIVVSWALLLIFGCHKKKTPIPPEETPPTIISEMPVEPEPTEEQNPSEQEQAASKPAEKPSPAKHTKHAPRRIIIDEPERPTTTDEAKSVPPIVSAPPHVVIQEGSGNPRNGQQSAGTPQDSGANYQATTQQLLDGAENNLRNLKRQLSDSEQTMVSQIRDYIAQSKKATADGDDVRAHNLALKARLLSDELVKGQ